MMKMSPIVAGALAALTATSAIAVDAAAASPRVQVAENTFVVSPAARQALEQRFGAPGGIHQVFGEGKPTWVEWKSQVKTGRFETANPPVDMPSVSQSFRSNRR